jgi:hypothetical protein
MPIDRGARVVVAWLAIFAGCGPTVAPPQPPAEPGPVVRQERFGPKPIKDGRQVMIGELCPQGAGGRPAVAPLVMRGVAWTDAATDLQHQIERDGVPRFAVFGVDGKVAGVFETVGLADIGLSQSVAAGAYSGASPCTAEAGLGQRTEDPACGTATRGCGIAIGELGRADDPPPTSGWTTGGACVAGDVLVVDIDGDGATEQFPLIGILDGIRSPAEEWVANPVAGTPTAPPCKPTFQVYNVRLAPPPEPGRTVDAKAIVTLSLLAVVDVDGDGRRELVCSLDFPTVRTIVVYTAASSPRRLELAGEGTPFQR